MKRTTTFFAWAAMAVSMSPVPAGHEVAAAATQPVAVRSAPATAASGAPLGHPADADYPVVVELAGAVVRAQTETQASDFAWALDRYARAGMELPEVEAWVQSTRSGCAGPSLTLRSGFATWRDGRAVVFACAGRYTMLHELGHVFDRHALTDADREAFMQLRGVDSWQDGEWLEMGQEHLADVVAWGLDETTARAGRTRPNDDASLAAAFELVAGVPPLG